jgi:uncharacterized protein
VTPLAKILVVLTAVLLAACVVSPPIYWGVQALAEHGLFAWLAEFPFHRYFSRILQVTALVAVVPLLLWLRLRHLRELGLDKNPCAGADVAAGVVVALLPAAALGAVLIASEVYRLRKGIEIAPLVRILLTAGVVACVEEFLFRGVLLGLAARAFGAWRAAAGVSVVFAAVHFLRPSRTVDPEVAWHAGFAQVAGMVAGMPPWGLLGYGMATLFAAGMLLAWAALRTRSLWLPIGLHAGWILGQQGLNWLAKYRVKPPEEFLPWIGPSLVSGVVPTGLLPLAAFAVTAAATAAYLAFARRDVDR